MCTDMCMDTNSDRVPPIPCRTSRSTPRHTWHSASSRVCNHCVRAYLLSYPVLASSCTVLYRFPPLTRPLANLRRRKPMRRRTTTSLFRVLLYHRQYPLRVTVEPARRSTRQAKKETVAPGCIIFSHPRGHHACVVASSNACEGGCCNAVSL